MLYEFRRLPDIFDDYADITPMPRLFRRR